MTTRKTGKYGTILVAQDEGFPRVNVPLVLSAEKTIQGEVYEKRFFGVDGGAFINMSKPKSARLQGLVGSAYVLPDPSGDDDKISVSDIRFFKDNGDAESVAASIQTLVRASIGEKIWAAIVVDFTAATPVIGIVYGTPGAALLESFGTAAGTFPLLTDKQLLIVGVQLDDTSAPIVQADIVTRFSDGTVLQERSDMPKFDWMPLEGGILVQDALLPCHTDDTPRNAWISFHDQINSLVELGHTTQWGVTMTLPNIDLPAQNDISPQAENSGPGEWTSTLDRYAVDETLFDIAQRVKTVVVKLYRDRKDLTRYYHGVALVTDFGETVDQTSGIMNNMSLKGVSPLEFRRPE